MLLISRQVDVCRDCMETCPRIIAVDDHTVELPHVRGPAVVPDREVGPLSSVRR